MAEVKCDSCSLRAKYDAKPKSLLGRFWRWHIGFCPGWKAYLNTLNDDQRNELKIRYNLKSQ